MAGRVLIVDDNEDLRDSFTALLSLWGHEVADAGDGDEALALVAAFQPDVVILDLGLPGAVAGEEVARRIHETCGQNVFIIVLTGWSRATDRDGAFKAGAHALFLKPADLDELRETLDRATRNVTKRGAS